jgi:pimeloyl-ACP methyl ester carboxylesterase
MTTSSPARARTNFFHIGGAPACERISWRGDRIACGAASGRVADPARLDTLAPYDPGPLEAHDRIRGESALKLVFIHGSGCTAGVWRLQLERFPDALALTLPGRGDGEHLGSVEAMARWVHERLREQGISKPVIVGHSLGGAIALQVALDFPGEAAGLCLIGSGARLRVHPATLETLEKAVDEPATFHALMAETWRRADPDLAGEMQAQSAALGPVPFLNDLRACDAFDVVERLGEIDLPTLAIVGTGDVMTPPKYAEFLRDHMPCAKVEIVEGGTHFVFAELPDEVNAALARFLDDLDG